VTNHDWESVDHPAADERLVVERDCARCPALAACRTEISWGNGARDATLVVVGEAPAAGDPPDEESETTDDPDPWAGGNHTGLAYTSRHSGRRVRETVGVTTAFVRENHLAVPCWSVAQCNRFSLRCWALIARETDWGARMVHGSDIEEPTSVFTV
jgi:hypothetical protein